MKALLLSIFLILNVIFAASANDCTDLMSSHPQHQASVNLINVPKSSTFFPEKIRRQETNYYIHLPSTIRPDMLEAMAGMANVKNTWTRRAAEDLKLMDATREEFSSYLGRAIEEHLSWGQEIGLNKGAPIKLLNGPIPSHEKTSEMLGKEISLRDLVKKYDLQKLSKILTQIDLTINDPSINRHRNGDSYYSVSMDDMFLAASIAGLEDLANEAFLYLLRLGDFHDAARSAQMVENHSAIFMIGKLHLTKFLFHNSDGDLWNTIYALKMVQAEEKGAANALLEDLADFVVSKDFSTRWEDDEYLIKTSLESALLSLASTGETLMRVRDDSVKIDYITRISNPRVKTKIKILLKKAFLQKTPVAIKYYSLAAFSLNDQKSLRDIAIEEFKKLNNSDENFHYKWSLLYRLALLSEDKVLLKEVMTFGVASGHAIDLYLFKPEVLIVSQDMLQKALDIVKSPLFKNFDERDNPTEYMKDRDYHLKENVVEEDTSDKITQVSSEQSYILTELDYAILLPLEERQRLSRQGYQIIETGGSLWEAYTIFLKAADLEGLLYVGRVMNRIGLGFYSNRAFLAAAMLMPEELPKGAQLNPPEFK